MLLMKNILRAQEFEQCAYGDLCVNVIKNKESLSRGAQRRVTLNGVCGVLAGILEQERIVTIVMTKARTSVNSNASILVCGCGRCGLVLLQQGRGRAESGGRMGKAGLPGLWAPGVPLPSSFL